MKNQRTLILWCGHRNLPFRYLVARKDYHVIPDDDSERPANRSPKILLWGPVYDSLTHFKNLLPQPWAVVGDPDGPNDIAAVVLNVSSIKLVSIIVRPDDSTQPCSIPFYAPMDTINVLPYLKKQTFSIPNQALQQGGNGVYAAYLSYSLLTEGGLVNDADVFGQVVQIMPIRVRLPVYDRTFRSLSPCATITARRLRHIC